MFEPDERLIYQFKDRKGETRSVDPLAAYDAFVEALGDESPEELFRAEDSAGMVVGGGPEAKMMLDNARAARLKLLEAIRKALGVASLEDDPENGLTRLDTFRLWYDVVEYLGSLKKSTDATP